MRIFALMAVVLLSLSACDNKADQQQRSESGAITVSDVYSFVVPSKAPVAAIFMTITNESDQDDRMVGFVTDYANKVELHTMAMDGDIMRMRQVSDYTVPAGGQHLLKQGGDHVMLFGVENPLSAGETFAGVAVFEKAGEIPVTVDIHPRK